MNALAILAVGIMCIASFYVGAKIGQTASKGETVEMPTINPVKIVKEYREESKEKKAAEQEKNTIAAILHNIDVYDGTEMGQTEVPR